MPNATTAVRMLPPALSIRIQRAITDPQLADRVRRVLDLCNQIQSLPDTGMHRDGCWKWHTDCFAALITATLTGQETDRG